LITPGAISYCFYQVGFFFDPVFDGVLFDAPDAADTLEGSNTFRSVDATGVTGLDVSTAKGLDVPNVGAAPVGFVGLVVSLVPVVVGG